MNQPIITSQDWHSSEYAARYFSCERPYLATGLRQAIGPSVLQIGEYLEQSVVAELDLPFLVRSRCEQGESADLIADPAFLPFEPDSFAAIVLPHVLEGHQLPHQVLREAHRVLMSEGHIVITGFNPLSLMGAQRLLRPKAVCNGRYYTVKRVTDWLQLLGLEVVASSTFQYAPLFKSNRLRNTFHFLEAIGERWLPMTGGGYMITAKKREASGTLVGRVRFKAAKRKLVRASASAKSASDRSSSTSNEAS